jgi:hypothetical protein
MEILYTKKYSQEFKNPLVLSIYINLNFTLTYTSACFKARYQSKTVIKNYHHIFVFSIYERSTRMGIIGNYYSLSQEDRAIMELVKRFGNKRWAIIAHKMVETYGLKQCRERLLFKLLRWHNHLDSSINKNPWT